MKTIKVLIQNEVVIPKLPPELVPLVKGRLTINNPEYVNALKFGRSTRGLPKYLRFYKDIGEAFFLPRGFYPELLMIFQEQGYQVEEEDNSVSFDPREIKQVNFRDYQVPWVEDLMNDTCGVGVAAPGAGKTAMAIGIYARLGQPCIWLTHTRGLANQAIERLREYTGEEAGFIGSGKMDIKHFTVGLVPTLAKRDLTEISRQFGLVISDECHHQPAETWYGVVNQFHAKYRYGLTATPFRDDGLEDMMFHALGPARAWLERGYLRQLGFLMTPTVYRKHTAFNFPYNSKSKKFGYKAMEEALGQDVARNAMILGDVLVEAFVPENTCIILVGRVEHGELLFKAIDEIYPSVGLVHSKMPSKKADKVMDDFSSGRIKILIATYRMLAEGFDYPPANRLFLTAPFKGRTLIEQACGRVERIATGKIDAKVFDYVDDRLLVLRNQSEMRRDVYEANDTPVVNLD
jgi:superfamily II DNA or RNA helicase